ncbi:uncharacterized protein LOC118461953 [Anopheles albimanus]|uniref:Transmembrane protein 192 n=1 Tax=Anopheles albimanus TaxID=7167 RepID=A0A8W7K8D8_ANOAL|nr:uncharacterized protein LOC118461953 [Anopheles albimanus]XP_035783742.1 uncharacterized protein LOC118461953 [Anopheles albimanus]
MSSPAPETFPQSNSRLYSPPAMARTEAKFRPIFVIFMFSVHLLLAIAIVSIGLVALISGWTLPGDHASALYFIIIYLRVAYWLVTYVIHERCKHEFACLLEPDFDRYRSLSVYRKAPLQIATLWNVILLTVQNQVRFLFPYDSTVPGGSSAGNAGSGNKVEGALNPAITPQVFVIVMSALELLVQLCFYVPFVRALNEIRNAEGLDKETDLRYRRMTDTEIEEQPFEWQLERQAELIKRLRTEHDQLQRQAKAYGVDSRN